MKCNKKIKSLQSSNIKISFIAFDGLSFYLGGDFYIILQNSNHFTHFFFAKELEIGIILACE